LINLNDFAVDQPRKIQKTVEKKWWQDITGIVFLFGAFVFPFKNFFIFFSSFGISFPCVCVLYVS